MVDNGGQPADRKREAGLMLHSAMLNDAVLSPEMGVYYELDIFFAYCCWQNH
jgi:hypothetical protein